jgi:hypothetical protein
VEFLDLKDLEQLLREMHVEGKEFEQTPQLKFQLPKSRKRRSQESLASCVDHRQIRECTECNSKGRK